MKRCINIVGATCTCRTRRHRRCGEQRNRRSSAWLQLAWCGRWLEEATDELRGDGRYEQQNLIDVELDAHCSASGGVFLHFLLLFAALAGDTGAPAFIIIIIIVIIFYFISKTESYNQQ